MFGKSVEDENSALAVGTVEHTPGEVLVAFVGPTRRFPVGYVLVDSDASDIPLTRDQLEAAGFIA